MSNKKLLETILIEIEKLKLQLTQNQAMTITNSFNNSVIKGNIQIGTSNSSTASPDKTVNAENGGNYYFEYEHEGTKIVHKKD